ATLLSVRVAVPVLVRLPAPLITPEAVMLPVFVSKISGVPLLLMAPLRVSVPAAVAWTVPPTPLVMMTRLFEPVPPVYDNRPAEALPIRMVALAPTGAPSELLLPASASIGTLSVPALIVV